MDRMFKNPDLVHVHAESKLGPLVDSFRQRPYSYCGMDNYDYKGTLYKGFTDNGRVYILLSEPYHK